VPAAFPTVFNGFRSGRTRAETVKTVEGSKLLRFPSLKRGVNEIGSAYISKIEMRGFQPPRGIGVMVQIEPAKLNFRLRPARIGAKLHYANVKRILTVYTVASAIGFCFFVFMWPVSYHLNLSKHMVDAKITTSDCIALTKNFNLGFEKGSLWLYSDAMPYRGSMLTVGDETSQPPIVHGWNLGDYGFTHIEHVKSSLQDERMFDLPGVYFRRFLWRDSPPYTTLRVSLWYPIIFLIALPILWVFRHSRIAFKI
jgi:hypothetical protein